MNCIRSARLAVSTRRYLSTAVNRDLRSCTVQKLVDRLGQNRVLHQISQDKLLSEALDEMRKEDVDAMLVLKATSPVGVLAFADIARYARDRNGDLDAGNVRVKDLMSDELQMATLDMPLIDAARLLKGKPYHHLPVYTLIGQDYDEDTRFVALLSSGDILDYLCEED